MPWRYSTWPDCTRHWHWFTHVGPVERVHALLPACTRAGVLALPILAGPAAGPLLAAPVVPELPWIGAPGWVQTALPFGPGGYGYTLGGFGGGYGYAGGDYGPSPADYQRGGFFLPVASLPPPLGSALVNGEAGGNGPQTGTGVGPPYPAAGESPAPIDVPCPPALAVVAVALLGLTLMRRRHGA